VPGQTSGLIAGISLILFYFICYVAMQFLNRIRKNQPQRRQNLRGLQARFSAETAEELIDPPQENKKENGDN